MNDVTDPMTKGADDDRLTRLVREKVITPYEAEILRLKAEVRRLTDQLAERDAAITRVRKLAEQWKTAGWVSVYETADEIGGFYLAALDGVGQPELKPEPLESPTHAGHEARDVSDDGYCYRCGEYTGAGQ